MKKTFLISSLTVCLMFPFSGMAQGQGKGKQKAESKQGESSNKGGEQRGATRATEAQALGKGAESRGFELPKGISEEKSKEGKAAQKKKSDRSTRGKKKGKSKE